MCNAAKSIDQKIERLREELSQARTCRQEARSKHEKQQEALFHRLAYTQKQMNFQLKNSSSLAKYMEALNVRNNAIGPYMLRKQAALLQAFHQTETGVKQLQMIRRHHSELVTWMQNEGDRQYEEFKVIDKELLERLQASAKDLHNLKQQYKEALGDTEDELLMLNQADREDQTLFLEAIPWQEDDQRCDESCSSAGSSQGSKGVLGPLASSASGFMSRILGPSATLRTQSRRHDPCVSDSFSSSCSPKNRTKTTSSPRNVEWIDTVSLSNVVRKRKHMSRLEEVVVLPSL